MSGGFFGEFKRTVLKERLKRRDVAFEQALAQASFRLDGEAPAQEDAERCLAWFEDVFRFGLVERLVRDNGGFEEVVVHHAGRVLRDKEPVAAPLGWGDEDVFQALQRLCDDHGVDWNASRQFVSFNARIGGRPFRLTLLHPSLSPRGTAKAFIRSHAVRPRALADFADPEARRLLEGLVLRRRNLMVSGPTGSGKTSLVNALLALVPRDDHVVVIEDAGEIDVPGALASHLVDPDPGRLRLFCSHALRMSPDRIVVGEIRSHEVVPFILSSNTGHRGMASTIHANSAVDTLSRLSILFALFSPGTADFAAVQRLVHKSVDYVVHLEDKSVVEVIRVVGFENGKTIHDRVYTAPGGGRSRASGGVRSPGGGRSPGCPPEGTESPREREAGPSKTPGFSHGTGFSRGPEPRLADGPSRGTDPSGKDGFSQGGSLRPDGPCSDGSFSSRAGSDA